MEEKLAVVAGSSREERDGLTLSIVMNGKLLTEHGKYIICLKRYRCPATANPLH